MKKDQALEIYLSNDVTQLFDYCCEHSNLPGPRGNLELVESFYQYQLIHDRPWTFSDLLWLIDHSSTDQDPMTMAVATGLVAISTYAQSQPKDTALVLYKAMSDMRWRIRELVCEAYKKIGLINPLQLIDFFEQLPRPLNGLHYRAMIVTFAHPELLRMEGIKQAALTTLENAIKYYLEEVGAIMEGKEVLEKGLAFAPSVIIASYPEEGFALMNQYSGCHPKLDKLWNENLKKKRLTSKYPLEVEVSLQRFSLKKK